MNYKIIQTEEGYKVKYFTKDGSFSHFSEETYHSEAHAEASLEVESTDLNSMKINELRAYAKENDIDIKGLKKKEDIINKINGKETD